MRMPPSTGAAIGRMTSAPVPVAQSIGARPMIIVPSVRSFGRRRRTAPATTISRSFSTDSIFATPPWRADLVLELPAPLEVHPHGELHLPLDRALRLLDEADDVAVAHVELHVAAQHPVLALDHRRALDDADVGDLGERNLQRRSELRPR